MAIVRSGGKIVQKDGKLGTGQGCCCKKCSGPCDEENPCGEGCVCVDGQCVEGCSGPCDEENPCGEGCVCVDGQCVEGPCCCCPPLGNAIPALLPCDEQTEQLCAGGVLCFFEFLGTCFATCYPNVRYPDSPWPDEDGNCHYTSMAGERSTTGCVVSATACPECEGVCIEPKDDICDPNPVCPP